MSLLAVASIVTLASGDVDPRFDGVDQELVDYVRGSLAANPRAFFYVCPNNFRQTVIRSSDRELARPGGRHPAPPPPLPDKVIGSFGGRPSPEAVHYVRELLQRHNAALSNAPSDPATPANPAAPGPPPPQVPPRNERPGSDTAPPAAGAPAAVLRRRPLLTPQVLAIARDSERVQSLGYSADGSRLTVWTGMTVVIWDVQKQEPVFESVRQVGLTRLTAPRGNLIAFYPKSEPKQPPIIGRGEPPELETRDMRTGRVRSALKMPDEPMLTEMTRSISPDGRWTAAAGVTNRPSAGPAQTVGALPEQVCLADATTGKVRLRLRPNFADDGQPGGRPRVPGRVWSTSFSNDGRYLAAATSDGVLTVWDTARGSETAVFRYEGGYNQLDGREALTWIGPHDSVIVPVLSPVGFVRCDMKSKSLVPLGHEKARGIPGGPKKDMVYAFSPDAHRLVYCEVELNSGATRSMPLIVEDHAAGRSVGRIPSVGGDRVTSLAYSPDGQHVAIGTAKGHVIVYVATDLDALAARQQPIPKVE